MSRFYWCIILAAIAGLNATSPGKAQLPGSGNEIAKKAEGHKGGQHKPAAKPLPMVADSDGKKESQPDCGTPKECRAEKHDQDDLVAQQTAAKAAFDQANLLFWQTVIATIGVVAVIATLIFTHRATKAALRSVDLVVNSEKARLSLVIGPGVFDSSQNHLNFSFILHNVGRTAATLVETAIELSLSKAYSEFKPNNVVCHNTHIVSSHPHTVCKIPLSIMINCPLFITGYYKWSNMFEDRIYCDHFCYQVALKDNLLALQKIDTPDWPPDDV